MSQIYSCFFAQKYRPALFQYPQNYRPAIMKTAHSVAAHACGDTQICILLSGAEGGVFVAD